MVIWNMQIETLCILGHTDNDKDRLQHLEQQILLARSRPLEVVCEKGVLRNVAKFTGKYLSQSLFFNNNNSFLIIDSGTGIFL